MSGFAPVCLFVYNRPGHTQQTLDALKLNVGAAETSLFIFSDFAKNKQVEQDVQKVRNIIQQVSGFRDVSIIYREENFGLARSIISGVTEVLNSYDRVIVVEDDLVTSPYFLRFMNEGLSLYEMDDRVASVHGYVFPNEGLPETFFLRGADCWGWATWSRAWKDFEPDGRKLLAEVRARRLQREIDFNNATGFVNMLKNQIRGRNDSWAIRWHISSYLKGRLTLYPGKSYVSNIGFDNSGVHSVVTNKFDTELNMNYSKLKRIDIEESEAARAAYEAYFRKTESSLPVKIIARLRKEISGILKIISFK